MPDVTIKVSREFAEDMDAALTSLLESDDAMVRLGRRLRGGSTVEATIERAGELRGVFRSAARAHRLRDEAAQIEDALQRNRA